LTINNSLGPISNWGHSVYVFHFVGDEVQLQNVNIHPLGTKLIQVQGPWGAPTRTGTSFCEGVTTAITGFKIRFSLTHKAIWCLIIYYGMDGQAFHSVHGSWQADPLAGETQVNFFKLNFNDILE
jgi:hypothetical protein